MAGLTISDRILGRDLGLKIRNRFERCLEEEFTECDGRILPLRSEFTGLTVSTFSSNKRVRLICVVSFTQIPNICGVSTDCINTMLLTAYLPHIAHRNWAMIRKENIAYNEEGELQVLNLKGADLMDPCNYRSGEGAVRVFLAGAAGEFGDEKVRKEALHQLDTRFFPVEKTPNGAVRNVGLSASLQSIALMARLIRHRDLANATLNGPAENALQGPLLEECPFPEVLVAKAYSEDGKELDLVLYNGKEPGVFKLGFERMVPGQAYSLSTGGSVTADDAGKAVVEVRVDGRTQILLKPTI